MTRRLLDRQKLKHRIEAAKRELEQARKAKSSPRLRGEGGVRGGWTAPTHQRGVEDPGSTPEKNHRSGATLTRPLPASGERRLPKPLQACRT
jgi:hypothetical protein